MGGMWYNVGDVLADDAEYGKKIERTVRAAEKRLKKRKQGCRKAQKIKDCSSFYPIDLVYFLTGQPGKGFLCVKCIGSAPAVWLCQHER